MHKLTLTVAALALCAGAFAVTNANALPFGPGLGQTADAIGLVEKSQFLYGGRNYCWYDDGWQGPGFYWCGFNFRRGLGWGGPMGWHGWRGGGGPRMHGGGGPRFQGGGRVGGGRVGGPGVGGPRAMAPRGGAPRGGGRGVGGPKH